MMAYPAIGPANGTQIVIGVLAPSVLVLDTPIQVVQGAGTTKSEIVLVWVELWAYKFGWLCWMIVNTCLILRESRSGKAAAVLSRRQRTVAVTLIVKSFASESEKWLFV